MFGACLFTRVFYSCVVVVVVVVDLVDVRFFGVVLQMRELRQKLRFISEAQSLVTSLWFSEPESDDKEKLKALFNLFAR